MSGDQIANLVYLSLFLCVICGAVVLQMRHRLGDLAKGMATWALIFLGAILAVALWEDIRGAVSPGVEVSDTGVISIPRSPDGHYYATLDINAVPITFVVDTGASSIVLSTQDAESAGIRTSELAFLGRALTANGEVSTAPVTLEQVEFGSQIDYNLPASVNGGALGQSLLGMDYLQRFSKLEISGGEMILTR